MIRHAHHPKDFLGHGAYAGGRHLFRRSRVGRYHHSYTLDGTVAARMQEKPRDLFDRVFGTLTNADDADARAQRLKRSVLDSVVDQYRFYTGPNSPLGAASKGRMKDHLDRIREFEQRAFALPQKNGPGPPCPALRHPPRWPGGSRG